MYANMSADMVGAAAVAAAAAAAVAAAAAAAVTNGMDIAGLLDLVTTLVGVIGFNLAPLLPFVGVCLVGMRHWP